MNFTICTNQTDFNVSNKFCSYESSNKSSLLTLIEQVTSYLWIVLSPILLTSGVFGNMATIVILTKLQFWKKPTYILLVVLALTDTVVLCVGLSRYWIREVFKIDIRAFSNWGCKINLFVIYTSMQFSSAILVCVTFERFVKTRYPFRYKIIVSVKKTVTLITFCFVLLTGLNSFWIVTNGLVEKDGTASCDTIIVNSIYFEEFIYAQIDLSVLSIIPIVLMVVMNICIQNVLRESKQLRKISVADETTRKDLGKNSQMLTRMLFFTSTYFLIATVPISVYYVIESYLTDATELTLAKTEVARVVLYLFQFSNYAVNFFLYMATNKGFKRRFYEIFCCTKDIVPAKRENRMMYTTQVAYTNQCCQQFNETMDTLRNDSNHM